MPINPRSLENLLNMPRLPEGQQTVPMRVRGPAEAVAWAASLSPADRGAIFAAAYTARSTPPSTARPRFPKIGGHRAR